MASLTLLDSAKHANLRLLPDSGPQFAAGHHILPLRAEEITKAIGDFPVFLTRNTDSGDWSLSAVTSFEAGRNLYVEDNRWCAVYLPQVIETYPFYLMRTKQDDQYAVSFDSTSKALSDTEGEPLFDANGKTNSWVDQLASKLETQLQSNYQTQQFVKAIESAGLTKQINILVVFSDDSTQTIGGLHTIDEDKLQALDPQVLDDFNKRGYLSPIYAVLNSIFKLNALIQRHNHLVNIGVGKKTVRQIKLELSRDAGAAGHVS